MSVKRQADDRSDDASSSSDDGEYDDDPELTLEEIRKSHRITYPLRGTYTNWPTIAAFRELVQNWRDAIIKSYNLKEKDFCVEIEEKTQGNKYEIVYRVPRCGAEVDHDWLGYIHFKAKNGEGIIEVTNRLATLQPKHLDFGGSTKQEDEKQAGFHGEGLKLAALVLMRGRQPYHIMGQSGGFNWSFALTEQGRFAIKLTRMKPGTIFKAKVDARRRVRGSLVPFAFMPDEDVQFIIGKKLKGRDGRGNLTQRRAVQREDFESWTRVELYLMGPLAGAIISTKHGDLLTAENLRGKIYLKSLFLQSTSLTRKTLRFGYNFAHGHTNRERQSVADASEESSAIWNIWEDVLRTNPEMLPELSNLLDNQEEFADTISAVELCKKDTAKLLRDHLLGGEFANRWYYCGEDISKTTFAASVSRLLRACIRACPQIIGITLSFVKAGQLQIQLSFSANEKLFRVHERWLCMDTARSELALNDDLDEADAVSYTVKSLFADALEQVPREWFVAEDKVKTSEWQRKLERFRAEQRMDKFLRMEELSVHDAHDGRLRFKWSINARRKQEDDTLVEIQCHQASRCSHLRDNLLIAADVDGDKMACLTPVDYEPELERQAGNESMKLDVPELPTCQRYQFRQLRGTHYEEGFEEGNEYYLVMLLPKDPSSFIKVSNITRLSERSRNRSVALAAASSAYHSDSKSSSLSIFSDADSGSEYIDESDRRALSPGSEPIPHVDENPQPSPAGEGTPLLGGTEGSGPASNALDLPRRASSAASFSLGSRLAQLDLLEIDHWHEARSPGNVRAVIGIKKEDNRLPEEPRKRRRMDSEA